MPRAEADLTEVIKKKLKSAPPDGYVELRRMTYGEIIQRKAMMKLSMKGDDKDVESQVAMANMEINNFEFARCIIGHNLEKNDGTPFNIARSFDVSILDPRVGQEIEGYISELHRFENEEEEKN